MAAKAARVDVVEKEKADIEKEMHLLRVELTEECRLKYGAIEKDKFTVKKTSKFAQQKTECEEASNRNRENAREAEKKSSP